MTEMTQAIELQTNVYMQKEQDLFNEFFDSIVEQAKLSEEQTKDLAKYFEDKPEMLAKRDNLAEFVRSVYARADFFKGEAKLMQEKASRCERLAEAFKDAIAQGMADCGAKKVGGQKHYFLLKNNPASVEITNPELVPAEYMTWEPKMDKTAIKNDLQEGREVPGCRLVANKTHLEIK
jgi:hypothetical protein